MLILPRVWAGLYGRAAVCRSSSLRYAGFVGARLCQALVVDLRSLGSRLRLAERAGMYAKRTRSADVTF